MISSPTCPVLQYDTLSLTSEFDVELVYAGATSNYGSLRAVSADDRNHVLFQRSHIQKFFHLGNEVLNAIS